MNTTESYIVGIDPYDPLSFISQKINTIEIVIVKDGERKKITTLSLNKKGRINQVQRFDSKWVAYPPLNNQNSDKISSNKPQEVIEKYIYSKRGYLQKIKIYNLGERKAKEIYHVTTDNGGIASITKKESKQIFFRNKDGAVERIEHQMDLVQNMSIQFVMTFKRNQLNQVIEKRNEQINIAKIKSETMRKIGFVFIDSYNYNSKGQLISSQTTFEDKLEDAPKNIVSNFEYLDDHSQLISGIKRLEDGNLKRKIEYKYNSGNELIQEVDSNYENEYFSLKEFVLK